MSTHTEAAEQAPRTVLAPETESFPADHRRPRMTGRVVFVTGGTRGIGAAISRSFAEQGAIVAAGYSRDADQANQLLAQLRDHGVKASIHQGNVGSAEDCRRTVAEVLDAHGRLDVLVNNAGITIDKTVLKMSDEDWYKVLAVNLSGAFFMSQAALPHMIERGTGRIINISSIIGAIGNIGQANYAASKSGLFGLTKTLAREACYQLAKAEKAQRGLGRDHGQRRGPGLHRHRDARERPREGARPDQGTDPDGPTGTPRRDRPGRALPCLGPLVVHHRFGAQRQRRTGHVASSSMPNRSAQALGEIIRQQRELAEYSMRQFAQLAGISNPYLSQIERGLRAPSEQVLDAIAQTLKVSADALYEQAGVKPRGAGEDDSAVLNAIAQDTRVDRTAALGAPRGL